jgi:hypothetical protein
VKTLPEWYTLSQKKLDQFKPENLKEVIRNKSPCQRFTFVTEKYQINDVTYFQGTLYRENEVVAKVNSNAYYFWHCWVKKGEYTYLICNQTLYGYVVFDMEGNAYPYIDPKAKSGWAFSWKVVKPSPNGNLLAVQGDYIGDISEISLYEFSDPDKIVKVRTLDANLKQGHYVLKGWEDDKIVVIHAETETTVKISV